MNKRAQISLFLLIGIVLVVVVILVMHLKSLGPKEVPIKQIQGSQIKEYITGCMDVTLKRAIINLGVQGGFVGIPDNFYGTHVNTLSLQGTSEPIVYLYDYNDYPDTHNILQSLSDWQDELSSYVNNNLETCLQDFQPFTMRGYKFEAGKINSSVLIRQRDVLLTVNFPINVTEGNSKIHFDTFQDSIGVPLLTVHKQAEDIMNALFLSDLEGDKEPARAFCKQRVELGKFCPQQSIDFTFKIDKYLPYQYEFLNEPNPTTLWAIHTKFQDNTDFYFIFAAEHKYQHIIPP